jgi:hypothetical protein
MGTYFYMSDIDKRRIAEKQKNGEPLTSYERGCLMQLEQDAQQEGKRLAAVIRADNAKAIEAATPEWQRRPRNAKAELLTLLDDPTQFKDGRAKRRIAELREEAAAEEKRIDAIMEQKRLAHEVETDPEVQRALQHHDLASKNAAPEDQNAWTELRGLVLGGGAAVVPQYWQRAAALAEHAKQRNGDEISKTAADLDAQFKKYTDAHAEFAKSAGLVAIALDEAKRLLET